MVERLNRPSLTQSRTLVYDGRWRAQIRKVGMKLSPSEPDIQTIVRRIDQGDIDLQPDFQRQEVWATPKKRKLVDTVLRGWSIPPVHLVEIGQGKLEVLDGQQRLASLRDFVHNRFSIDGNITPLDEGVVSLHRKFYKSLDGIAKRQFDQYPIRCFKITDYLPEEPSELFYRLNQPTILTSGEQRNALFGPARTQLKELVFAFESLGNSKESLGFSNVRLAYDDILARLLFFLESGNFGVKSTESRISERFRDKTPFPNYVLAKAYFAVNVFSALRAEAQPYRFNKASVLSWLLFWSRFDATVVPPENFLQTYIDVAQGGRSSNFANEAIAVFEDRASLRVTDVSSVVYRDFSLCYLYHFTFGGELPAQVDIATIIRVADIMSDRDDATLEFILNEVIDIERWSASL